MDGQKRPEHFQAACKQRPGGYVIEVSVPLSELGLAAVPRAGDAIYLGLALDDRDAGQPQPAVSRMSLSGMGNESSHTLGYARCVFGN